MIAVDPFAVLNALLLLAIFGGVCFLIGRGKS